MKQRLRTHRFRPVRHRIVSWSLAICVACAALLAIAATSKVLSVSAMAWRDSGERERRALIEGSASYAEQIDAVVAIQKRIEADLAALKVVAQRGDEVSPHAQNARAWTNANSR